MFATASAKNEEDAVRMEELKEGINELREDVKSCEKILKNVDPSKAEDVSTKMMEWMDTDSFTCIFACKLSFSFLTFLVTNFVAMGCPRVAS